MSVLKIIPSVPQTLPLFLALVLAATFSLGTDCAMAEAVKPGQTAPDQRNEILIIKNLPDPNVYVDTDTGSIYLTGTGRTTARIFRSDNGVNFKRYRNISPSEADPDHDYCSIFAPDLTKRPDGSFFLSFAADRSPKGEDCDSEKYRKSPGTTFYMAAPDDQFEFRHVDLFTTTDGPRSKVGKGCLVRQSESTCERTIRIDADLFLDPATNLEHFFYVWFWQGNNISSFPLNDPSRVIRHAVASDPYEEKIIEAPDVFKRGPFYYLVYSRGSFLHNYGVSYMYGPDLNKLIKGQAKTYDLLNSVAKPGSAICDFGVKNYTKAAVAENAGHTSTAKIGEEYFIFYHKGIFSYDSKGCHSLKFRHTYRSTLRFRENGEIVPLQ